MKLSHPNLNPSAILGTIAKLIRLTEKEGVEWTHWQHPTNNPQARQNLAKYLRQGCPKVNNNGEKVMNQLPKGLEPARIILEDDYITPEEVTNTYGISYSDEQLEHFADTLPDIQTILWLRANGYILIAGPSAEMNLLEVRELDNKLFYSKTEGWYAKKEQVFAKNDKVKAGEWLAIRKDEVPNSLIKTWKEQQNLITEVEHVPNASEVSYAVTAYLKVRGICLRRSKFVRTSSVSADVNHVIVGIFGWGSLRVLDYWDGDRSDNVGVASSRK